MRSSPSVSSSYFDDPPGIDEYWEAEELDALESSDSHVVKAAIELYQRAAALGFTKAEFKLAQLYSREQLDSHSPELVRVHLRSSLGRELLTYRECLRDGDETSIAGPTASRIAQYFHHGWGVPRCLRKASLWYQRAVDKGLRELAYYVGMFAQDQTVAWQSLRTAALAGNAIAQCELGRRYEAGTADMRSLDQAAEWYQRAADQGYEPADELLASIRGQTTEDGVPDCPSCTGSLCGETLSYCAGFSSEKEASAEAQSLQARIGCPASVEASDDASTWNVVLADGCMYKLVESRISRAIFDHCNHPHQYLGSPRHILAKHVPLETALSVVADAKLEDDQNIMLVYGADGNWAVHSSITQSQAEQVRRLSSHFLDDNETMSKLHDIDSYREFVMVATDAS